MPSFTADDVLVAEGRLLYSPVGTALPDETGVAYDTYASWPSGWEMLGYTTTPLTFTYGYDVFSVEVQQSASPLRQSKTTETLTMGTTLAQFDGDILALVLSGTNTDTAAGASQKAFSKVQAGGSTLLNEYQFAIESYRPDANGDKQPIRVFVFKATITASGDIPFDKAAVTGIPVTISALADSSKTVGQQLIEIHIVTAPASS